MTRVNILAFLLLCWAALGFAISSYLVSKDESLRRPLSGPAWWNSLIRRGPYDYFGPLTRRDGVSTVERRRARWALLIHLAGLLMLAAALYVFSR
jgi:hypothetical protein